MVNETCQLCGREWPRDKCHIIEPTAEEVAQIEEQGQEALEEYIHCEPCWKVLSNPASGPAVLRGLFEQGLRAAGVQDAEERADKYHGELVKRATKPRS
jgi:hypothetical protein